MEAILSINSGSSSLKFALHPVGAHALQPALFSGSIQGLEPGGQPVLAVSWAAGGRDTQALPPPATACSADAEHHAADAINPSFTHALHHLRERLGSWAMAGMGGRSAPCADSPSVVTVRAVAHRVVHGGAVFTNSVRVSEAVLAQLAQFNPLAPLHQAHNLQGIRSLMVAFPDVPHIACFDTAFHAPLPPEATDFALPAELTAQGVRRFGFHGLSYHYLRQALRQHSTRAHGRVLMAHLGNGASLCAMREGRSLATTMGFSALDGLMMGTRSGSVDPGVLLYLMAQGWSHDRLQTLLYKQSGLLGVSGLSADMRRLRTAAAQGHTAAQSAIDLFTHRVVREAGAMLACLEGMDVCVFTGGIGEHDALLRAQVIQRLGWLGVRIDATANTAATGDAIAPIHTPESTAEVWVIPTDEGWVSAQEALAFMPPPGA
jgi:acetate kinase